MRFLKNKVTIEFRGRSRTSMSLFQRFFCSFVVLASPGLVLGAAQPVRVRIGTASFSSSTLSLWIAQEQGIFGKHGIEAQAILIRGGPTLVASLMPAISTSPLLRAYPCLGLRHR